MLPARIVSTAAMHTQCPRWVKRVVPTIYPTRRLNPNNRTCLASRRCHYRPPCTYLCRVVRILDLGPIPPAAGCGSRD
jgi:hypothetical protein